MPLSAERCQVTWGPNPLKRVEVGRGGSCVYMYVCGYITQVSIRVLVHEGVFVCIFLCVCLALVRLRTKVHSRWSDHKWTEGSWNTEKSAWSWSHPETFRGLNFQPDLMILISQISAQLGQDFEVCISIFFGGLGGGGWFSHRWKQNKIIDDHFREWVSPIRMRSM